MMHMTKLFHGSIFIIYALFVCVYPNASFAGDSEKVSIQLQWFDQFQFAGYYMAKEKGFYTKAGLDVTILPYDKAGIDVVDSVVSGKAQYGTGRSSLLLDYHSGKPVVALAAILQDSPLILLTRDDTGINSPGDLKGRTVMMDDAAAKAISILSMLYMNGVSLSDIQQQKHSYRFSDLIDKNGDALLAYIGNEPFRMRELGIGYKIFQPKSFGITFYGDILFTSKDEVENHPVRAAAFTEASLKGWIYAFSHMEETARLIQAKYNGQNKSLKRLLYEARELKRLAYKKGTPFGELSLLKLKKIEESYRLMNIELPDKALDDFTWDRVNDGMDGDIHFTKQENAFIERTRVRAATTTNWPPFAFVDRSTGMAKGIGYDYWTEIIKAAGLHTDIVQFDDFTRQLLSLKTKKTDLMYSSGITEERKKFAVFSNPYASFPIAIATSKEENFIQDGYFLRNKKVAIGRNFTAHKMMVEAYPDVIYMPVENIKEGLQLVSQGEAFAYVDIMPSLAFAINKFGFTNLKISGNTGLMFELRLMIRNDYPELVSIANKVIANFDPDLKNQIFNRWVNVQYQQAFNYKEYLPYAAVLFILVGMIIYLLIASKRRVHNTNIELERRVDERTCELLESQQQLLKLSQALEQSPSLVFITDTHANIEYANPKFLRTTGYTWEEVRGQNPRFLKSGEIPPAFYKNLWQTITAGKIWRGEVCDRCKDGSFFWASASISPIRGEDGQITHYLAVHEDITKHRDAELAMQLAVERSEIANRSKTEMLANMSHELRTPLNAIIGFSDTMRNQVFGPFTNKKYVEYANDINSSGIHLLELINDILDFSSIEAGKLSLVEAPIDISEVLNSSIRLIAPRFDDGKIKITTQYGHNQVKILVDKRRMKQIALNLLSNAAKFTNEGGQVSVRTALTDTGALEIIFADTGIGMTAKDLAIAMTRFGQVDGSLARKHQGTGLGLPLTQKLVEAHQGTFDIKSKKGKGTTITITLPKEKVTPYTKRHKE